MPKAAEMVPAKLPTQGGLDGSTQFGIRVDRREIAGQEKQSLPVRPLEDPAVEQLDRLGFAIRIRRRGQEEENFFIFGELVDEERSLPPGHKGLLHEGIARISEFANEREPSGVILKQDGLNKTGAMLRRSAWSGAPALAGKPQTCRHHPPVHPPEQRSVARS